jgi:putative DNA primase/helicase
MQVICSEEREALMPASAPGPPERPSGNEVLEACRNEEDGDAYLFARLFHGSLVYDHSMNLWFEFAGHHWVEDKVNHALDQVKEVIRLYKEEYRNQLALARDAEREERTDEANRHKESSKALVKRAQYLQKLGRKEHVLKLAASGKGSLGIDGSQWDANPWILACPNGVVDLQTGVFREGRASDFIKTACPTPFTGLETESPLWDSFLQSIFGDDPGIIGFMARLFGHAIVGRILEHKLPILHGQGRNGKGKMLGVLRHVLGDLAAPIDTEMLLESRSSRNASGPSPDIMHLRGRRLVWGSETSQGRKLNLNMVKMLTGDDELVGRPPHGTRNITFRPSHTMFLLTNALPHAPGNDYALWQRLVIIPFQYSFVDNPAMPNEKPADKEIEDKLKTETSGILSWLIRGCLDWQIRGKSLDPPERIAEETEKYREDEDLITQFLRECCEEDHFSRVQAKDLYDAFRKWCLSMGIKKQIMQKTFGADLTAKIAQGTSPIKSLDKEEGRASWYLNIRLLRFAGDGGDFCGEE